MKKRRIIVSDDEEEEDERVSRNKVINKQRNEVRNQESEENELERNRKIRRNKEKEPQKKERNQRNEVEIIDISYPPSRPRQVIEINPMISFLDHIKQCAREGSQTLQNKRLILFQEAKKLFDHENFTNISSKHLLKVYNLIDRIMFNSNLTRLLNSERHTVTFRLSQRMTSRAGQLSTEISRPYDHELAISSELLFKAFSNQHSTLEMDRNQRQIQINGLNCFNRLDCLLRIVEHEIIHLVLSCSTIIEALQTLPINKNSNHHHHHHHHHHQIEVIDLEDEDENEDEDEDTNNSRNQHRIGCMPGETYHGKTFRYLVKVLFGHTEWKHDLITQDEIAHELYQITVGSIVEFEFDGERYSGKVNRIQKRVTVLVKDRNQNKPHSDSREFSDGNFYRKFYVPIQSCRSTKK